MMNQTQYTSIGFSAALVILVAGRLNFCQAWMNSPLHQQQRRLQHLSLHQTKSQSLSLPHLDNRRKQTRLYNKLSRNDNNTDDESNDSLFSKAGTTLKSIFGKNKKSEEEKKSLTRRKETRNQVSGSIKEALKDAPLGVRMMGEMISPLIGGLASTLQESMAEAQRSIEQVLDDAQVYLENDPDVTRLFGSRSGILLGKPISQNSYTTSVNGNTESRLEMIVPVSSGDGFGSTSTVKIVAINNKISQMDLNTVGQQIRINLRKPNNINGSSATTNTTTTRRTRTRNTSKTTRRSTASPPQASSSSSYSSSYSSSSNKDDNVIEAEIIDKDTM